MKKKTFIIMILTLLLLMNECSSVSAGWLQNLLGIGSNETHNTTTTTTTTQSSSSSSKPAQKPNNNAKAQEYVKKYGYDAEEIFDYWSTGNSVEYNMSSKARDFLRNHPEMFMGTAAERHKASDYIDSNLRWNHIEKNSSLYGDKTVFLTNVDLHQIFENRADSDGNLYSKLNVCDSDGNQYYVYYFGTLKDLYADTKIDIIGIPLDFSHFDNISGGKTLVVVLAGCVVGKAGTIKVKKNNVVTSDTNVNGHYSGNISDPVNDSSTDTYGYTIESTYITVTASDGYANLRTGPGTEYDIIMPVPTGEMMEFLDLEAKSVTGKTWIRVAYYVTDGFDGGWCEGWVAASQTDY